MLPLLTSTYLAQNLAKHSGWQSLVFSLMQPLPEEQDLEFCGGGGGVGISAPFRVRTPTTTTSRRPSLSAAFENPSLSTGSSLSSVESLDTGVDDEVCVFVFFHLPMKQNRNRWILVIIHHLFLCLFMNFGSEILLMIDFGSHFFCSSSFACDVFSLLTVFFILSFSLVAPLYSPDEPPDHCTSQRAHESRFSHLFHLPQQSEQRHPREQHLTKERKLFISFLKVVYLIPFFCYHFSFSGGLVNLNGINNNGRGNKNNKRTKQNSSRALVISRNSCRRHWMRSIVNWVGMRGV